MLPDYYHILGIPCGADLQAIKKAYRVKAISSHPDHGGSHEAMLAINEAYEILSNPVSKRHYDDARANLANQNAQRQAQAEASQAQRQAEQYPRNWTDFESWLAKDFGEARYGNCGQYATIGNSVSGFVFVVVGMILGAVCGLLAGYKGGIAPLCVIGGITGQWLHKQMGKSMKSKSAPPGPIAARSDLPVSTANPPSTTSSAQQDGALGVAIVVGILAFVVLLFVCRTTVGDGFFAQQESIINWPAVFIGTGICAFIGYQLGKKR